MITCLFLCEKVDSRFTQRSADAENVLAFNKAVISFVFFFLDNLAKTIARESLDK